MVGALSAKAAWDRLAKIYASGSRTQIHTLKSAFFKLHHENNENIAAYTQRAKSMADRLAALQNPVNDDDLVQVITNGLGSKYRPFVRSLENHIEPVTFDVSTVYYSVRKPV